MFNPIKNVVKGIGLLQGFFLSKDLPKPVQDSLKLLIETIEKPLTQWRQPITLEDDEIERIAHLVSQRIIDEGPHKLSDPTYDWEAERAELVNRLRHLEGLLDEKQKEEPTEKTPDTEALHEMMHEAVKTNKSCEIYLDHAGKKMCYRCVNLVPSKPGEGYQKCAKYGVRLRAVTAERICNQFEEMLEEQIDSPVIKCVSCSHFRKAANYCERFDMRIRVPSRNMWGVCGYWHTRFNEPVVFAHAEKQIVREIDKQNA